jgi:hypothetical protein
LLDQRGGEISFTAALMGECQQLHHGPAGDTRLARLAQALPGRAVGRTREQRVPVDEMQ